MDTGPILACMSPARMGELAIPGYVIPPHIRFLSDAIVGGVSRGGARLIVTMPPRHGKSQTCSHALPLWYLTLRPGSRALVASYGDTFATRWGRRVRRSVEEYGHELGIALADDSKAANEWDTSHGGGMTTAGVGGSLTGRGFGLVTVDDPHKDAEEASSETMRERTWEWWQGTLLTRLEPGASIVVVATRWHEDDLVGRLLAEDAASRRWEHIDFPAIAEECDALGRRPGDALWPERFDAASLLSIKESVGSRVWASLYQQRPSPAGGSVFRREHLRYAMADGDCWVLGGPSPSRLRMADCRIWQGVDTAMKDGDINDWTCVVTLAVGPRNEHIVVDVARARIEVPEQLSFVAAQQAKWRNAGRYRGMGVEDKASGTGLIQSAARFGLPLRPIKVTSDKVTRATPAAALCEAGRVWLLAGSHWIVDFESELLVFPNGKHDDQVDAFAHAVSMGSGSAGLAPDRAPVAGSGHRDSVRFGDDAHGGAGGDWSARMVARGGGGMLT